MHDTYATMNAKKYYWLSGYRTIVSGILFVCGSYTQIYLSQNQCMEHCMPIQQKKIDK